MWHSHVTHKSMEALLLHEFIHDLFALRNLRLLMQDSLDMLPVGNLQLLTVVARHGFTVLPELHLDLMKLRSACLLLRNDQIT